MRAISSLALVAVVASCSAIDNFGKFTVGGPDMAGGGCTPGCDCIAADPGVGAPAHCRIPPINGLSCAPSAGARPTISLPPGTYQLDTGVVPPVLTDGSGRVVMTGSNSQSIALFCVGSFLAEQGVHVVVVNDLPAAIIADSVVRIAGGSWTLAGAYAIDENGAPGDAGGSSGGSNGNSGAGAGGGKGGSGAPGTGGGGGGAASQGAFGGSAVGGTTTPGGPGSMAPLFGFGGGGGGKGSTVGGGGGGGGGALQLSASWSVTLDAVAFDATGGGGAGGGAAGTGTGATAGGGGGGGGGGTVTLDAPMVSVTGGCISVIGGPGGAGGGALVRGGDAHASAGCPFVGTAGSAPPNGGNGGTAGGPVFGGGNGSGVGGGGGGLGAPGRVTVRSRNPPPAASVPGIVPPTAYVPVTLP